MFTEEHIKEELSRAYVNAIAANAGIMSSKPDLDYGIDGTFSDVEYDSVNRRFFQTGFNIDFQLKSTVKVEYKDGNIIYDLEIKNYRDLIRTNIGTERILILYILPRNRIEWLRSYRRGIILKTGAWWCSLKGMSDINNKSTVRIHIPDNQLLTSDELIRLMECVKGGVEL